MSAKTCTTCEMYSRRCLVAPHAALKSRSGVIGAEDTVECWRANVGMKPGDDGLPTFALEPDEDCPGHRSAKRR